jgi:hypothetical protein
MTKTNLGKIVIGTLLAGASALIMECSEKPKEYKTISGEPLSASYNETALAVVIKVDGKAFAGSCRPGSSEKLAIAYSIVQSEISDNDKDKMDLTGYYTAGGNFKILSLRANGSSLDLKNPADWD